MEIIKVLLSQPLFLYFFYPYFALWLGRRSSLSNTYFFFLNVAFAISVIVWQQQTNMEIKPHDNIDSFFVNNRELNLFHLFKAKPDVKFFNFRPLPQEEIEKTSREIKAPQLKEELNYITNLLSNNDVRFYYLTYGMDGLKYQAQLSRSGNNKSIRSLETFYFELVGPSVLFYT